MGPNTDRLQGDLAAFVASAPGAVAMFDRDMRYLAVSRRYAGDYGLPDVALIGRSHYELFPEISESWRALHARALAGACERCEEDRFPRADGRLDYVTWELRPWRGMDGEIGGIVLLSEVVTEVVERRTAVLDREQRLQRMFDRMPIGVAEVDGTGCLMRVNAKLCEIVGWSRDELLGTKWSDLAHPEDRAHVEHSREVRLFTSANEVRWVRVTSSSSEAAERTVLTAEDVTDLVVARDELKRSELRQRELLDALPVGIALVECATGVMVSVNDRLADMLRSPKQEIVGRSVFAITHPEDLAITDATVTDVRVNQVRRDIEKRYLRGDGSELWAHTRITPLGTTAGFNLATIDDITERRAQQLATRRAEDVVRQSEAQLRMVFEALPIPMGLARADGQIISFNEAFIETFGYTTADTPTIAAWQDAAFPDAASRDRARDRMAALQRGTGRTSSGVQTLRCKHGGTRDAELNARRVGDSIIAVYHDVTDVRRANAALLESQEWQRLALESAELATWHIDFEGSVVELDARARMLFAIAESRIPLDRLRAMVHPEDDISDEEITQHFTRGAVRHTQRFVLAGGEVRWIAYDAALRFGGAGRAPIGAIVIGRDVTESRRVVEELRASEERYRSLVDNLADVVFTLDARGTLTFINRAAESFGYTPAQLIGTSFIDLVAPVDRTMAIERNAARLRGELVGPVEYRLLDAAGKIRYTRITTRTADGGLAGIAVDLTAMRSTEEQLRAAQKLEAIGRLAGGVAHDFNNLLTVIMSYADLAQQTLHDEDPLFADLQQILDATTRASTLTRRLLAFSRKQVLAPQPVEIHGLVDSLGRMLGRLIGEDIELAISTTGESTWALADPGQIEQVVMNLAINARDAMPDGGHLAISTSRVRLGEAEASALEVEPGDYVRLVVHDTGCGMDEATRTRIFEPFFTTKPVGKGTGLGLSMVYGIVKQSRGGLDVETSPGNGASFAIYLPSSTIEATVATESRTRVSRGKETILLVEDELPVRTVAERVLVAAGYSVLTAATPSEALAIAVKCGEQIELVFSDVVMPEMNGRELADRLRSYAPRAKVLFTSGYTDDALARSGVLAEEFLPKPYDPVLLEARIRNLLDHRRP